MLQLNLLQRSGKTLNNSKNTKTDRVKAQQRLQYGLLGSVRKCDGGHKSWTFNCIIIGFTVFPADKDLRCSHSYYTEVTNKQLSDRKVPVFFIIATSPILLSSLVPFLMYLL